MLTHLDGDLAITFLVDRLVDGGLRACTQHILHPVDRRDVLDLDISEELGSLLERFGKLRGGTQVSNG